MTTLYIKPALTDQAGQCRIYLNPKLDCGTYDSNPQAWREVGLMNSEGFIVCGEPIVYSEMKDCEPLMAGMLFKVKG